jgi:hypothetical protein
VQWLVLRHELPDQHVLDHRIVASYAPIAPLVTMSCRLLLCRVASRGVLPRERFSPVVCSRPPDVKSHEAPPRPVRLRSEASSPITSSFGPWHGHRAPRERSHDAGYTPVNRSRLFVHDPRVAMRNGRQVIDVTEMAACREQSKTKGINMTKNLRLTLDVRSRCRGRPLLSRGLRTGQDG